jgi:hypothetical protein
MPLILSHPLFWAGVLVGGVCGLIAGVMIGIRLYLRTGKW